ncbi:rhomboid family intramembrane serine protease [Calidifontibacter terrae]
MKAQAKATPRAAVRRSAGMPVVTYGLIGLCVVLWLGQEFSNELTYRLMFAPALAQDEPWRFLTAAFVHDNGSPLHLLFNMLVLFMLGQILEPALGRARYLAIYLVCALGGSVGYEAVTSLQGGNAWFTGTVGASGAIFGLFLAMLLVNIRLRRDVSNLIGLIVINTILSFVIANVAWQAHLGGAITGALCGLVVTRIEARRSQWFALGAITVALAVVAYVVFASHTPVAPF